MTVAVSTVTSMYDLADSLLNAVAAAMATTDGGAPDRQFVALGAPVWDTMCSQACVQMPSLTEAATRDNSPALQPADRHSRGSVNLIGMTAYAIRCIESSQDNSQNYMPPDDAQLSREAKIGYEDGWAIWNYVKRSINNGTLFGGPCGFVYFDGGVPVTPAGGLGGFQFTCRVELGGYDPTGS